jgi:hypothetical protein
MSQRYNVEILGRESAGALRTLSVCGFGEEVGTPEAEVTSTPEADVFAEATFGIAAVVLDRVLLTRYGVEYRSWMKGSSPRPKE